MEHRTQCNGYGISAAHDQNTETSSHEEGGGGAYSVQCHTEIDLQTACFQTHITLSSLVNTPDSPAL